MAHTQWRWHVVAGNLSGFQPQNEPSAKSQTDRSCNHKQVTPSPATDSGLDPVVKRSRTIVRIIGTPVYLVDNPSLGWLRNRRHREVCVAAQIAQKGDFTVEAAPRSEEHTSELQSLR